MKISEIAALAGVSVATISRYLNGGSVSTEKKEKIKKIIEETGYAPNATAQSLRKQQINNIGVIVPKINSESVSNVTAGISSVLNKNDFIFIFGNTNNDEKREIEYLNMMQENHLAGIILMGTVFTPKHKEIFKKCKVPLVICGQNYPNVSCIYHDDKGAAKEITNCIIKKGRTKLAYIGVNEKDISVGFNRRVGVEEAMRENGLNSEKLVKVYAEFSSTSGFDSMNSILDNGYVPDGVICATDTIAIGAMQALKEKGFNIPDDISVGGIGCNKTGTIISPNLTTVKLFQHDCGVKAAKLLLSMIEEARENPKEHHHTSQTMLGYSLVERESV